MSAILGKTGFLERVMTQPSHGPRLETGKHHRLGLKTEAGEWNWRRGLYDWWLGLEDPYQLGLRL